MSHQHLFLCLRILIILLSGYFSSRPPEIPRYFRSPSVDGVAVASSPGPFGAAAVVDAAVVGAAVVAASVAAVVAAAVVDAAVVSL